MTDKIKNHERDIAPARTQNSAISEHDIETGHVAVKDQVRFIDHDLIMTFPGTKEGLKKPIT